MFRFSQHMLTSYIFLSLLGLHLHILQSSLLLFSSFLDVRDVSLKVVKRVLRSLEDFLLLRRDILRLRIDTLQQRREFAHTEFVGSREVLAIP